MDSFVSSLYNCFAHLANQTWVIPGEAPSVKDEPINLPSTQEVTLSGNGECLITEMVPHHFGGVISYLSLLDLHSVARTCKYFHKLLNKDYLYELVSSRADVKHLIKQKSFVFRGANFQRFIKSLPSIWNRVFNLKQPTFKYKHTDLKSVDIPSQRSITQICFMQQSYFSDIISSYRHLVPKEIVALCNRSDLLSSLEIQNLQKYITARDTIIIGELIGFQLQTTKPFSQGILETGCLETILNQIDIFKKWANLNEQQLQSVKKLDFYHAQLSDIRPLSVCPNLEELSLNNNHISDLNVLKELSLLKRLHLDRNKLVDISPLETSENLEELFLNQNTIKSIDMLSNLNKLRILKLCQEKMVDMHVLKELPNLEHFEITGVKLTDLSIFEHLKKLKFLVIGVGKIDLKDLEKLRKNISGCQVCIV